MAKAYDTLTENELHEESERIKQVLKVRKSRNDKGKKRERYRQTGSKKFHTYQKRANARGFEFELTDVMFDQLKYCQCVYCGGTPTGFDRMDNSIGYTIENSVPCCFKCNMMKYQHTYEDFIKHCKKVYLFAVELGKIPK